jgi:hypothetical protein
MASGFVRDVPETLAAARYQRQLLNCAREFPAPIPEALRFDYD